MNRQKQLEIKVEVLEKIVKELQEKLAVTVAQNIHLQKDLKTKIMRIHEIEDNS